MSIQLKFQSSYQSLNNLCDNDFCLLPDFTVLTGLNGAGKTQLLNAINSKKSIVLMDEKNNLLDNIKYIPIERLYQTSFAGTYTFRAFEEKIAFYKSFFINLKNELKSDPKVDKNKFFSQFYTSRRNNSYPHPSYCTSSEEEMLENIKLILEKSGKNIEFITEDDIESITEDNIMNNIPIYFEFQSSMILENYNIAEVFKIYSLRKDNNDYKEFRYLTKGEGNYLTEDEFIKENGLPPWDLLNQAFEKAKIQYKANIPCTNRLEDFKFTLISNIDNCVVDPEYLSTGEKFIGLLALTLFTSDKFKIFPDVLLMDEPDAYLHPSMTKNFLDVIYDLFVKKFGIKVIITTHSPSTVALAPDESIYLMNRQSPRISYISKNKAMKKLLQGVNIYVDYNSRIQIFVEGKHDVKYYEQIYNAINNCDSPKFDLSKSLYFVNSSDSSNCDQVKEVVSKLTNNGCKTVFGIIDWDLKNQESEYVKVLGKEKRYSIENYILDPLLLCIFLIREQYYNFTIGQAKPIKFSDIQNLSPEKLQLIIDQLVSIILGKIDKSKSEFQKVTEKLNDIQPVFDSVVPCQLLSGISINLPIWYLYYQGHALEKSIKEAFPQLNKYKEEDKLKLAIINKVINDFPQFISSDIIELFQSFDS
jgi:energy-coupling factor transporter ATP-binding protein EcfA2